MGKYAVPFLPLVEGPFSLLASPLSELASVTLLMGSPTFNGKVGSLSPSKNLLNMLSSFNLGRHGGFQCVQSHIEFLTRDRGSPITRRRDRIHTGVLLHTVYDVNHTLRTAKSLIKRRGSDTN